MKIELTEQEAAYLHQLLWIIYLGLKGEQESDSPKERVEERKEAKELIQNILDKVQKESLENELKKIGVRNETDRT